MVSRREGRLFVVATPIGNLEDVTLRALRVLRECDQILAEDTRHTKKLCASHEINTPLRSLHEHTKPDKIAAIVDELRDGATLALVSDAGTPLVSDPGRELVALAAEAGVEIEVVPGPSALTAALSVAGLPFQRFAFEGFLPRSGKERRRAVARIRDADCSVVFFESPHRVARTLRDLVDAGCGERRVAVCRELTKVHEEVIRGMMTEAIAQLPDPVRGEITIVVEGAEGVAAVADLSDDEVSEAVLEWHASGLRHKEMVAMLRERTGWSRDRAYQAVLEVIDTER